MLKTIIIIIIIIIIILINITTIITATITSISINTIELYWKPEPVRNNTIFINSDTWLIDVFRSG